MNLSTQSLHIGKGTRNANGDHNFFRKGYKARIPRSVSISSSQPGSQSSFHNHKNDIQGKKVAERKKDPSTMSLAWFYGVVDATLPSTDD